MTTETKFRAGLTLTLLGLIIMQFFYFENIRKFDEYKISTKKQIDSLTKLSDTLYDKSFENFIEAGRYESALEIYREKNPKAVKEIEEIKNTQTE
jgi:predicted adenine nucleotide alpha hydrolase (AANH) superfamily ATPase